MTENQFGFGLALLKEEGGSYIWDEALGDYRKMTPEELARYREQEAAEWVYARTFRGRFRRFLYRVGNAWHGLWSGDGA